MFETDALRTANMVAVSINAGSSILLNSITFLLIDGFRCFKKAQKGYFANVRMLEIEFELLYG